MSEKQEKVLSLEERKMEFIRELEEISKKYQCKLSSVPRFLARDDNTFSIVSDIKVVTVTEKKDETL